VHAWIQQHGVPVHILSSFVVDDPPSLTHQHQTREDVLDASAREQESWSRRLFELDVTDVTSHLVEGDPLDVVRWHTEPGDLLLLPADFDHRYSIAHGLCPVLIAPTASRKVNLADKIARDAVTSDA
jgi:hypothetical protein